MTQNTASIEPNKALLVLCISSFLVPFMGSALNLALPEISRVFSMKAVTLTWMATAYLISTAIFQVPFARMADLMGRKKVFMWGVLSFSIFTILCSFSPSGTILIILRFLSGMGSAMMFGTSTAILSSIFPGNKRGKALGINTAVVYFSLAAGPFLGGLLTHFWGWQSIFFVCGGIGLLVVIFSYFFLNAEWIEAKGQPFDYLGSTIYGIGLFGLIFGFTQLPKISGFCWLAGGIMSFILFVYFEKRNQYPVFNVRLFSSNRIFALSSLSALINYSATSAIAFMLSLYLQYVRGLDARHAGLVLISQACVQSLCSLVSGPLSDKIAASKLATSGMIIIVGGLIGLTFITISTPIPVIIIYLVLLGMGFGIFSSPNANVIMGSVDAKYYGQASATMGTMRLTGQAFSMGIAGMAIALQVGNRSIEPIVYPEFLKSMHITFVIFAVLCAIGVYASAQRTKK